VINNTLLYIGVINEPIDMMYSLFSVVIVMIYIMLPYMALSLYSVMRGIDIDYVSAAETLGASRLRAVWRIFVPLSKSGSAAGSIIVFILSAGYFITPSLMGGSSERMIAMVIANQVETYFNWPL